MTKNKKQQQSWCADTMKYFVYILKCSDKTLYTGYTNDLEKRIIAHNTSKFGAKYIRGRRPVKLVYFKKFKTKSQALKMECAIKKLNKKEKIDLISNKIKMRPVKNRTNFV